MFPATYTIRPHETEAQLVGAAAGGVRDDFAQVDMSYARSKNLTPYDVLTIASMIEREARVPGDRAKVSAVIYNRLHRGMPLGIDATILYHLGSWTATIHQSDLDDSEPYNTRIHKGLPPTPDLQPRAGLAAGGGRTRRRSTTSTTSRFRARPPSTSRRATRSSWLMAAEPGRRRAAVIGHPVAHSRSPRDAHRRLSRRSAWTGRTRRSTSSRPALPAFVAGLDAGGLAGVNVTIPHKQARGRAVRRARLRGRPGRVGQHRARARRPPARRDAPTAPGSCGRSAMPSRPTRSCSAPGAPPGRR